MSLLTTNIVQIFLSAAIGLFGLLLWWFIRQKNKRLWLPTVRILELDSRILPKLVWHLPPLLAFMCFLVATLSVTSLFLRPAVMVPENVSNEMEKFHVFVDMSPSVMSSISKDDLRRRVVQLFENISQHGEVSLSFSHDSEVFNNLSPERIAELFNQRDFHKSGLKLVSVFKKLYDKVAHTSRLYIVSDRDRHTWQGFNWHFLDQDTRVFWVEILNNAGVNLFIADILLVQGENNNLQYNVQVKTSEKVSQQIAGKILAYQGDLRTELVDFYIAANHASVDIEMDLPEEFDINEPVTWQISGIDDLIDLDNEYTIYIENKQRKVSIISRPYSESLLLDPTYQLSQSLSVLGFSIERYDGRTAQKFSMLEDSFFVIQATDVMQLDDFCPAELSESHLGKQQINQLADARIWLVPESTQMNFKIMCQCFARLTEAGKRAENPDYCSEVESRNQFVGLLDSLGAKQIGGNVGDLSSAVSFSWESQLNKKKVVAFSVPLRPGRAFGFSHDRFPIVVKDLIDFSHSVKAHFGVRKNIIEDIAEKRWGQSATNKVVEYENVPSAESILQSMNRGYMPPKVNTEIKDGSGTIVGSPMSRRDPLTLIKIFVLLVITVVALEGGVGVFRYIVYFLRKRAAQVALAIIFGHGVSERVLAEVAIETNNFPKSFSLQRLSKEVSSRTSIVLADRTVMMRKASDLATPWIWSNGTTNLTDASGHLNYEIIRWLTRGGLLIIEGEIPTFQLNNLTKGLQVAQTSKTDWFSVPPDHELMRSFYLLDKLPSCNQDLWKGFLIDQRIAILVVSPYFLESLADKPFAMRECEKFPNFEMRVRAMVNILMVGLATDYKKDQVHLPEILKRLR